MDALDNPDFLNEARYRFWVNDTLRFGDTDLLGHINTASYISYCDTARLIFCSETGLWSKTRTEAAVVLKTGIRMHRELFAPGEIRIGTLVTRIGTTSLDLVQGLFTEGSCAAVSATVLVHMNMETHRPHTISDDIRAKIDQLASQPALIG